MKRPHRRLHLVMWIVLAPAAAAGLILALRNLPADARGPIPDSIVTGEGQ